MKRLVRWGDHIGALCGFLALFVTTIQNLDKIANWTGHWHYSRPTFSNIQIVNMGAFETFLERTTVWPTIYAFPTRVNPYFSDPKCFSAPVLSFSVTNPNDTELIVSDVGIEIKSEIPQQFTVGKGPMVAGANFMIYEAVIDPHKTYVNATFRVKDKDYLKVGGKESEQIRVYLRADTPSLVRLRGLLRYSIGSTTDEIPIGDFSERIYFFSEVPPNEPH